MPATARAQTTSTPYDVLRFVTQYAGLSSIAPYDGMRSTTPYDGLGPVLRSVRG